MDEAVAGGVQVLEERRQRRLVVWRGHPHPRQRLEETGVLCWDWRRPGLICQQRPQLGYCKAPGGSGSLFALAKEALSGEAAVENGQELPPW